MPPAALPYSLQSIFCELYAFFSTPSTPRHRRPTAPPRGRPSPSLPPPFSELRRHQQLLASDAAAVRHTQVTTWAPRSISNTPLRLMAVRTGLVLLYIMAGGAPQGRRGLEGSWAEAATCRRCRWCLQGWCHLQCTPECPAPAVAPGPIWASCHTHCMPAPSQVPPQAGAATCHPVRMPLWHHPTALHSVLVGSTG